MTPEENNGWISTTERLPENDQNVLFYTTWHRVQLGIYLKKDQWDRENVFCNGAFFDLGKVTHWQPLPQKPL